MQSFGCTNKTAKNQNNHKHCVEFKESRKLVYKSPGQQKACGIVPSQVLVEPSLGGTGCYLVCDMGNHKIKSCRPSNLLVHVHF